MMDEQLKSNVTSGKQWLRLLYMLFFILCLQLARFVVFAVAILQFLFVIITGQSNKKIRGFGRSLTEFISQALLFITYNSESKPFPFSDWPLAEDLEPDEAAEEVSPSVNEENTAEANSDADTVVDTAVSSSSLESEASETTEPQTLSTSEGNEVETSDVDNTPEETVTDVTKEVVEGEASEFKENSGSAELNTENSDKDESKKDSP